MLSPSPLSLFCGLLLCFPLALLFTFSNHTLTLYYVSVVGDSHAPINSLNRKSLTPKKKEIPNDDELLLLLASRVNPNPNPKSTRKLAFMFLTTSPLPLAPLWEIYFNGSDKNLYNIYIHADPRFDYTPPFSGVFAGRVIPSKPAMRFTPTLISAARRLLAHALLDDDGNYMFAIFSPSCVPIRSFKFTYTELMKSGKSFIEILENEPGTLDRWAVRGEDAMLPEVKLEDFRIGSQFWVLTRRQARVVVDDEVIWNKFNKPCLREDTCYPEENYFPTLLNMMDPGGSVPATLTHVDWSVSWGGHPREYQPSEVGPGLILRLRRDRPRFGINGSDSVPLRRRDYPFLFARKFSPVTIDTLLTIANGVLFKD